MDLLAISNDKCIFVEFVNESSKLNVGFRNWLKVDFTDLELDEIIKNQTVVEIAWPKADIRSASNMKRVLKGLPMEGGWKQSCPVKIHRFGGKS